MSQKYLWPDGSTNIRPYKRKAPAKGGFVTFLVKLRCWINCYRRIYVDNHIEGNKIVKRQAWILFHKIPNGKLPKQGK